MPVTMQNRVLLCTTAAAGNSINIGRLQVAADAAVATAAYTGRTRTGGVVAAAAVANATAARRRGSAVASTAASERGGRAAAGTT